MSSDTLKVVQKKEGQGLSFSSQKSREPFWFFYFVWVFVELLFYRLDY